MDKYFQLHGKTADGDPLIHLVEPGTTYGLSDSFGLTKTASGEHLPEVIELIESIQPQPGRLYLVNSALGAGEYVGFNLRGDWFTEKGLTHVPRDWHKIPVWEIEARRRAASTTENVPGWGSLAWGYPTFYNAHRFRHHQNKDPRKAYGYTLGAFWDHRMHRVILVTELIRELCENLGAADLYDRIARGEFPDTSMGAKVPYDQCSICGHKARSPSEYCEHVRQGAMPPYGMRALLPDGRRCGVYNYHPRFFDDSFVFIGAERSAKVMDNVTDIVKGNHAYTQRVFTPGGMELRLEHFASATFPSRREEMDAGLGEALAGVMNSRLRGPQESKVSESISQLLSVMPVESDEEAKAMHHAAERAKKRAASFDGSISPEEVRVWENKEQQRLSSDGVLPEQRSRAMALLNSRLDKVEGVKLGSLAKWAELIKRIPVPSHTQSRLLADHVSRLSPELPRGVLDSLGRTGNMHRMLNNLAELGVVLRPHEFQHCALHHMGEGPLAGAFARQRVLFDKTPLDMYSDSPWPMTAPQPSIIEELVRALGSSLHERSFAPMIIAVRISRTPPVFQQPVFRTESNPLLNRISQMYNDYRTGLIVRDKNWKHLPFLPAEDSVFENPYSKLAEASDSLSDLLFGIAFL